MQFFRVFLITFHSNEDNKKSASNLIDETANPVLPPRPSGIRVPTTSSEDESEEQDYDEQSDIELLTVHTKTTKQHVPPTKKEDSGIVVLSESETESDDEVQVVSVTPNKKIIELDMDDLHNDDDDEEEMDLTWPALTTSTTSDQRLAAYTAPEGRTQNTGAQDSHELRLPGPTVYRNVEDLEKTQVASNELDKLATITPEESVSFLKSENENEEAGDDTQGLSTTQSTIASSTQTSGLPASIYPNLLTASTHPDSSTHTVSNHYRPPPFRIVQSRWDVGPTLAPTVAVNPYSQYVSSLYEASDVQTRAKEFQNGTHELKAIHDAAFSVEQNVSAPPAPTLPKCALVEQPSRVTVPADKSKMSIRNIIEPVSESGSPDPEVVAATQADLSTDQMEASTKMQTEAPATKQNIELTSSGSKKRKVDEVDHLFVEPLSQDSAYALHTSTNLAAKELDAEVLHSIRHKRPFIMETTHARIKSAVRARLAEKRATRGIEIKKTCNKTAWMASVKPFLLGTLVGSVGVFGALLSLPGME